MRKLISHPGTAIELCRKMIARYRKCCARCGVIAQQEIHHTDQRGIRTYFCRACGKTFTELSGTIFYRSKVPLHRWMVAIILWITSTGSVSAAQISRQIGVSEKTSLLMWKKMREEFSKQISIDQLCGEIEADEAWFGRKENQEIILGLVERTKTALRKLRLFIVPNVKERTLCDHIEREVVRGSLIHTDSHVSYSSLNVFYHHETVNHSKGEFGRSGVHSNTIEQIWGSMKGIIRTIHHGVSKKYRHLYLAQFIFRYENEHASNLFYLTVHSLFHPTYCTG